MQPCSGAMQGGMTSITACLQELQNGQQQQISHPQTLANPHFEQSNHDDFLDQMLSIPSWSELSNPPKFPWELNPQNLTTTTTTATTNNVNSTTNNNQKLFTISLLNKPEDHSPENLPYYDESSLLASRLRQHQISSPRSQNSAAISSSHSPGKSMVLQLNPSQLLVSRGMAARSPVASAASCISDGGGLLPLPLTLGQGNHDASDTNNGGSEAAIQGLYNGFAATQQRSAQTSNQHFHPQPGSVSTQTYGAPSAGMNQAQAAGSAGCAAPGRQRVRARRGQATDPHSIAERLRRERIAERMKALQELVPNANKTDKASMLDEIIDYVKFLQLQVKVLSMSRLGGAAAIAPLVADMSSEGGDCIQASGIGWSSNGNQPSSQDSLTVTEHQVAKLMEEDMGSAMQYLQGKGLCLMPISLASAISTTTCHSRNPNPLLASNADAPSSPSMSVLTVQSAMANGADTDVSRPAIKDAASVSKP